MGANQKSRVSKEAVELELMVLLEEHKTLRDEILANLDASRQILNLTLTGAGLFLAISPLFVQSQLPVLFLVVPFVFYAMAWSQLRYVLLGQDISRYLREAIEPNIRRILADVALTSDRSLDAVMGWSEQGGGLFKHHTSLWMLPIAAANYGIPLLAAVTSLGAYIAVIAVGRGTMGTFDWVLLAINGGALIYSVIWGFRVELEG